MSDRDEFVYVSDSVDATRAFGRLLGSLAAADTVVALVGPLGAGKTQLVKGVATGLDVPDERKVTSPTFVIMKQHPGRLMLFHADAYRVGGDDLEAIGLGEWCTSGGVVVIEWADRVVDLLPSDHLRIEIEPTGPETRRLACTPTGETAQDLLNRLREQSP